MSRLAAREQLAIRREYPSLIPGLCARGLSVAEAAAVAHNVTFLYYALMPEKAFASPEEVLSSLSLEEIAEQCLRYDPDGKEML